MQNADVNFFLRKRYLFCFLKFIGMLFVMVLRTNLSIAIVEMSFSKNVTLSNGTVTKVSAIWKYFWVMSNFKIYEG